ncbi:transposase [Nonomuraea sp. NPDC050022]|uniref:transposase n=1 Tax=Nonomuraea sp. NPDC050022 TaxID=3364358 RepID=UPI0037B70A1E
MTRPRKSVGDGRESNSQLRTDFYACLTARVDALFELTDAVLCTDGPVRTLAGLSLPPEHRRGTGALYDALNKVWIEVERLRGILRGLPLPRCAGERGPQSPVLRGRAGAAVPCPAPPPGRVSAPRCPPRH